MVSSIKFIISAALLSQASAAVINRQLIADDPVLAYPTYSKLIVGEPVLATRTASDLTKRDAVPTSVPTDIIGKLIVGDPVLAIPTSIATPVINIRAIETPTVPVSVVIGELIVGDPVLATRIPTSQITAQATTMATSVIRAIPTSVSL